MENLLKFSASKGLAPISIKYLTTLFFSVSLELTLLKPSAEKIPSSYKAKVIKQIKVNKFKLVKVESKRFKDSNQQGCTKLCEKEM